MEEHRIQDVVQECGKDWEDRHEIGGGGKQHECIQETGLGGTLDKYEKGWKLGVVL